jgi:hypothetical protein
MPRIVVEDHSALIWKGGNIEILVDGVERAKLKRNLPADFAVQTGSHTIQARSIGAISRRVHFVAADRETLTFSCVAVGIVKKSIVIKQTSNQRSEDRFNRGSSFVPTESRTKPE